MTYYWDFFKGLYGARVTRLLFVKCNLPLIVSPATYVIINLVSGNFYIGSTSNLRKRASKHRSDFKSKQIANQRLQDEYIAYIEPSSFIIYALILNTYEEARTLEQVLLLKHHGTKYCLNLQNSDDACGRGYVHGNWKGKRMAVPDLKEDDWFPDAKEQYRLADYRKN